MFNSMRTWLASAIMPEQRASLEDPRVPISSPEALALLFGDAFKSATGVNVTTEGALGVPAVWSAVNFISGTIASLPLQLFRADPEGNSDLARSDPLYTLLHDVVNEDRVSSFKWRKQMMTTALTEGRAYTYIERNKAQRPANFWPLDPSTVTVKRKDNVTTYEVRDGGAPIAYGAADIIDIPFMMEADGLSHRSPFVTLKNALGLAIALESYASRFFQNGGVPPLALQGPPASTGAIKRATGAIEGAIRRAQEENRNVLYMPTGHELKPVAFNPEQGQLTAARAFQLLEIARIYCIPPTFLQDLSHGTFSNTEQQDLHFVKHTLTQWLELWESELNAKLFAPGQRGRFAEFNVDGLLRGDFKSRMEGSALAVQSASLTPNEARALNNRPPKDGGDELFINSATIPISQAGQTAEPGSGGETGDTGDDDD